MKMMSGEIEFEFLEDGRIEIHGLPPAARTQLFQDFGGRSLLLHNGGDHYFLDLDDDNAKGGYMMSLIEKDGRVFLINRRPKIN
jgi:hypothetical protein